MKPERLKTCLQEAIAHQQAGRLSEADALYKRLRSAEPDNFYVLYLSGLSAHQQGRSGEAIGHLGRALRADPKSGVCRSWLGLAFLAQGDVTKAEECLRVSVEGDPSNADGWEGLALCLKVQDRIDEALACHRRVVALRPRDALAWCNFGLTLRFQGRLTEALACQEQALAADPHCVEARFGKAQALQHLSRLDEAVAEYDGVVARAPRNLDALSYRLVALHYLDGVSRERLFEEHVAYGRALGAPCETRVFPNEPNPVRRLRVAILSQDLRSHSCAFFIEPLIAHLDRSQFELLLYFDHFREDDTSRRLRTHAAVWRNFVGVSAQEVERAIREDAPDILMDLSGHTSMVGRLPLLARRLAPVQVSYLGYPDTTGVPAMDFRFTDAVADPAPEADGFATERLVRFAPTAWAYRPPADSPEPQPASAAQGAPVTFGCFNYLGKITDSVLGLWGRLLEAVPHSRLMLKGSGFGDAAIRSRYAERMRRMNVDVARVVLVERTTSINEHLALYNDVDVALDTFPYNGTTTTCESLWMGVPVVSLRGDRHVSRVGASLLAAVGHPEWVASGAEDYVRIATDLASNPQRLAAAKRGLRGELTRSAIMDHAGQARRFGDALRACWQGYCDQRAAAPVEAAAMAS